MSETVNSLQIALDALPGDQLTLFPEGTVDAVLLENEYRQGVYSGKQLQASKPEMYRLICELLADGSVSQRQISKLTGHSRNLVSAIARTSQDIEPLKKRIADRARNLAAICLERAEEIVASGDKVTLRDLSIMMGIALDKSQLLSGEATQRVESIESSSGASDFEDQFNALQRADVEELPSMGLAGESLPAKGAGGGQAGGQADGVGDGA